ncbi:MAG: hypothetical protein PHO25_03935 [Syntrophomonadaceae bacterium]|nr:hypothetical protein [Syntrophomonadaceae bacterium]
MNRDRLLIISCFIKSDGQYHSRISKYFEHLPVQAHDLIEFDQTFDLDSIVASGQQNAERLAESIFLEQQLEIEKKLRKQEESRRSYFKPRQVALMQIAVDNIRNARLRELQNELEAFRNQCQKRRKLIPSLNCEQMAYVEFIS